MSIRRIGDVPEDKPCHWEAPPPCLHPEHNPPTHMVFQPGVYEHECPGCGRTKRFTVRGPSWQTSSL